MNSDKQLMLFKDQENKDREPNWKYLFDRRREFLKNHIDKKRQKRFNKKRKTSQNSGRVI
jgi:hypothetical protein